MGEVVDEVSGVAEDGLLLWVIVRSHNNLLGFDASIVGNMIAIPPITRVPEAAAYVSGTISVRGSIIPLVDLRVYTGQPSGRQEIEDFCTLMDLRLSDHENWIKELKLSVEENRSFDLATDPHKCAFGEWYDSYKSDNRMINIILKKFDNPHKTIHGIAEKVNQLVEKNQIDEAHALIDATANNELLLMVGLFTDIKNAACESSRRRIAMVIENDSQTIALDIDEVVAVEQIVNIEDAPRNDSRSLGISRIGRRKKNDELVLLMENAAF